MALPGSPPCTFVFRDIEICTFGGYRFFVNIEKVVFRPFRQSVVPGIPNKQVEVYSVFARKIARTRAGAPGDRGARLSLDSMLSSCLLRSAKLCSQWSLSFCMYRIANLYRNFPDCIYSYGGSMVENLRMHCIIIASSLHHHCIIIASSLHSWLESWRYPAV
jgi:hypothetical protein